MDDTTGTPTDGTEPAGTPTDGTEPAGTPTAPEQQQAAAQPPSPEVAIAAEADAGPDAAAAAAAAAATPLAQGAVPVTPGWYTTESGPRYWDGSSWLQQADAGTESGSATYGEKWKRRYPVVLLVIALLEILSVGALIAASKKLDLNLSTTAIWGIAIGVGIGIFVSAAIWTSLFALFGGRKVSAEERAARPWWRRAWTWAPIAVLVLVGVTSQLFRPAEPVATVTITSEAQGCQQFLITFEDAAKANVSIIGAQRYLQPLADAAATSAPQLAQDLQAFLANPTEATLSTSSEAVIERCVSDGHLTAEEVSAFAQRLQALGG